MSTLTETVAEARIRDVPWAALQGLIGSLEPALREVLDAQPAERVVDRYLRAHRTLDNAQRRACVEALFGVGLWRRRLRAQCQVLQPSALQLLAALIHGSIDPFELLGLAPFPIAPTPTDWRDRFSVPDWLATELTDAVGDEAPELAAALNEPGPITLRVNRARTTREALQARLAADGIASVLARRAPDALIITTPRPNLFGSSAQREGLFEVQDEGSQLLGELLHAQPGDRVFDACAGAGGKSLQLAALGAHVTAADVDGARLERLRQRAERAQLRIAIEHSPTASTFDRVLVDAPCSELGALRRGPDVRWRIDPTSFTALPALQLAILTTASQRLRVGGRLVYATCTWRREENEAVVDSFLQAHSDFHRAGEPLRLYPHRDGCDGFFAVAMTRLPSATKPTP